MQSATASTGAPSARVHFAAPRSPSLKNHSGESDDVILFSYMVSTGKVDEPIQSGRIAALGDSQSGLPSQKVFVPDRQPGRGR